MKDAIELHRGNCSFIFHSCDGLKVRICQPLPPCCNLSLALPPLYGKTRINLGSA